MTTEPQHRPLLPMTGLTCGNRSPVTCHKRCGDACAFPAPNSTDTTYFRDIAAHALSRRALVGGTAAVAAAAAVGASASPAAAAAASAATPQGREAPKRSRALFTPIGPVDASVDDMTVPSGWTYKPVIRWGDPILAGAPAFDPEAQTARAQAGQFGYNCDYLDILETSRRGTSGLLVCNHEYTNEPIMFPPGMDENEKIRVVWEAHGLSVVELQREHRGQTWTYVKGARLNRRITINTEFAFDGPARGSALLTTSEDPRGVRVRGTMNNCSGGTTPWGTVLSGEENFNQYFYAEGTSAEEKRYGLGAADTRNWRSIDPRWDATRDGYRNEPNRFGWIVEVDPFSPHSTPVKHTAMGRLKHEGANVIVNGDGHVVAYMGDDERFDYVYRFVSRETYRRGAGRSAQRHNRRLLSDGDLSVAKFNGDGLDDGVSDGSGEWIPLTRNGRSMVPGMSIEEVLVYTRLAADKVGPTKMDRPEDVQPNLTNGYVYVACTNNTSRTPAQVDEANPRPANKNGHIVEIRPRRGDHTDRRFAWNLLLLCGKPGEADTYFGGYQGPVSPISCPDNVAFDSQGDLWISTDGQPGTIGYNDGLHKVPLSGPERGRVMQFLAVPTEAETCGPVIHDRDGGGSIFVAVQHPGENGTWDEQHSYFPDFLAPGEHKKGRFAGPRPTVVQVTPS